MPELALAGHRQIARPDPAFLQHLVSSPCPLASVDVEALADDLRRPRAILHRLEERALTQLGERLADPEGSEGNKGTRFGTDKGDIQNQLDSPRRRKIILDVWMSPSHFS